MPICSKCQREFPEGEYLEKNKEIVCFHCLKKHTKKHKTGSIICPYCEIKFDISSRRCPRCHNYNPITDFHFDEYFFNTALGYLVVFIALLIPYMLSITDFTFGSIAYLGTTIFLSLPLILLFMFIFTGISLLLFYLGRYLRNKMFERKFR